MSFDEPILAERGDASTAAPSPRGRLATRLTVYFFLASLLLIAISSAILYATVVEALRQADIQVIEKRLAAVTEHLDADVMNEGMVAHEVDEDNQGPRQIFIRLITGFRPLQLETPAMDKVLPSGLFPDVSSAPLGKIEHRTLVNAAGATYQALAVRVPVKARPGPSDAVLQVATDTTLDDSSLSLFRSILAVVLAFAVPLCAALAWLLVRREMKPLARMAEAAQSIDGKSLNTRLTLTGMPQELHTLGSQFNQMLSRIEATNAGLRDYADNIAHELRTPVNRMRLAAEIALRRPMTAEEYQDCISGNVAECESLSRLLQGLLFLARAENGQAAISAKPFPIEPMFETIRSFFEDGAAAAGIQLTVVSAGDLTLKADKDLIQRALANLIANALTHSKNGGTVRVTAAALPSGLNFRVEDNGEGIAPEHHEKLFDRFYRGGKASMGPSDRLGLGLAITKSIVDLHGGTIQLDSSPGRGTAFTLTFPERATASDPTFASVKSETPARRPLPARSETRRREAAD